MENDPKSPRKYPDIAALIAGAVALVALVVWVVSWLMPLPQEEALPGGSDTRAQAKDGETQAQSTTPPAPTAAATPALPPLRAVPPGEPTTLPLPVQPPAQAATKPAQAGSPKPADPGAVKPPPTQTARVQAPPPEAPKSGPRLDALRGRYVGNALDGSSEMIGVTLVISGVENGVIKATATIGGRGCDGDYPMQGTFQNNKLDLGATRKGGPAGDCPLTLALAAQGNTLVGAMGNGNKVQLSKK